MKFVLIIGNWIKTHLLVSIICLVAVIGGATTIIVINTNTSSDKPNQSDKQSQQILIRKDLNFEINSEVSLLSLVDDKNTAEILSEDELIDTSILGEKEISIKYLSDNQEKEKSFKINIIDTTAPTIQFQKELSTTVGNEIDLLKDVSASDNSKEDIKVIIEGEYNFNKEGIYNLKYVAVDSSNNKIEEEFTLRVNANNSNTNTSKEPSDSTSNNEKPEEQPPVKEEPPVKLDDPLANYCDNNIAGYKRNDDGICTDLSPNDSCKYQPCFGGDMPMREYFESEEEYKTALNTWIENNYKQAKKICAEKGLGWKYVDWNPNFGSCTWN